MASKVDDGFVKGQADNFPKINSMMLAVFYKNNTDFTNVETRGVKAEKKEMLKTLELLQHGQINAKYYESTVTFNRMSGLDISKHSKLERFHEFGVTALDLEKQHERHLLSGGKNGDLAIYDLLNTSGDPSYIAKVKCKVKSRQHPYAHKNLITAVQWFPFDDGAFITSSMDHHLKIWDSEIMKPVESLPMAFKINAHSMSTKDVQHNLIAVGMKCPNIVLVDPRIGARCHELRSHRIGVSSLKWSPVCENLLVSGGYDSKIYFWDIRSAKSCLKTLDQYNGESIGSNSNLKTAHDGMINSIQFTPDGLHLVSHGLDGRLRLWDVALCKNSLVNFGVLSLNSSWFPLMMDMCFNNSLSVLFVPCDNHVFTYDLFTGLRIQKLTGHFDYVSACVYRSSTHELYSSSVDQDILVWTPDKYASTIKRQNIGDMDNWSD